MTYSWLPSSVACAMLASSSSHPWQVAELQQRGSPGTRHSAATLSAPQRRAISSAWSRCGSPASSSSLSTSRPPRFCVASAFW